MIESALYAGNVMHHRFAPKRHRFKYRVVSALLDLDELYSGTLKLRLFSVNKFNLFSWHSKDHGDGSKRPVSEQIRALLAQGGLQQYQAQIKLLCYPRILGFVFNPLSVYYCYDSAGKLGVILYEVSNTFGERHTYLIPVRDTDKIVRQRADKAFYVSPFMPMQADYQFRMQPPAESVAVCIRQSLDSRSLLHATFTGKRQEMNDRALFGVFIKYPLMTLKVIVGIHWEALQLWRKGVRIQPRVTEKNNRITLGSQIEASQHETL
ncbi:MAG: DUF1365 domain-containing protein [Oceanospirillaceae bacterium]|nr:DUF1365 domain-containing protein [Oceanospirillaceae bacterium]